jgi:hypothetical protein
MFHFLFLIDYPAEGLKDLSIGALPQNPNHFFVLTQKSNQKRSRLSPLRTKNYA